MSWLLSLLALSINTYQEAGNQGYQGMKMVNDVVINRTLDSRYPDTPYKVIMQKHQFSWTNNLKTRDHDGLIKYQRAYLKKRKYHEGEIKNFRMAFDIALTTMTTPNYKTEHNYMYFYSGKRPYWARGKVVFTYKNHNFM